MTEVGHSCDVFGISNYNFGTKEVEVEYDGPSDREEVKKRYESEGMARKTRAVILVHLHNHPHLLLLKSKAAADKETTKSGAALFQLPGGLLETGESESEGLQRILAGLLSPLKDQPGEAVSYSVVDSLATLWRPNFEEKMFPYLPVHVSYPKESTKIFLVGLSGEGALAVPKSFELRAVPMYELFDNPSYGALLGSIPQLLSRFKLNTVESK